MSAPLFPAPPALSDEALGVRAWFADAQATVVMQVRASRMTEAVARYLVDVVYAEAVSRYVSKGRKARFLHDWRDVETYDPAGRDVLIQWGHASLHAAEEVIVCLGPKASPLVRIATTTGIGLLRMLGHEIRQVDDLDPLVAPLATLVG
jgi:hypothetical protein